MLKILYATDGAEPAVAASSLLEKCARRDDVELTVLSVFPEPHPGIEAEARGAEAVVEEAVARLRGAGFEADGRTAVGQAAAEIVAHADRDRFDVIAMGAGNKRWYNRLLLGSQSTRVLHGAPCSVLIVHEGPSEGRSGILVGADGSKDSRFSIATMSRMVDPRSCEAAVLAVAQVPYPTFVGGPGVAYVTAAYQEETQEDLTASAQLHAEEAAATLRGAGFTTSAAWVLGSAAIRLLEEAEETGADLVVVGSRGLGPIDRWVMGSVSDKMARYARATLVARPPD